MGGRRGRHAAPVVQRLGLVLAVVLATAVIVLAPGWQADDGVGRPLVVGTASTSNPPTSQTIQDLATQLNDVAGDGYDQPIDPDRVAAVVTQPGEYRSLGRLSIPSIGLDVEVGNGVDPITLERGPGHWTGTPMPGQPGNSVVSGHRTTHTAPFLDLDQVDVGDDITVTTDGHQTRFVVTEVLVVPVASYETEVLAQPEDPNVVELTLFACHPEGSVTHRIVVHAERA